MDVNTFCNYFTYVGLACIALFVVYKIYKGKKEDSEE